MRFRYVEKWTLPRKTKVFDIVKTPSGKRYSNKVFEQLFGHFDPKVVHFTKEFKGFLDGVLDILKSVTAITFLSFFDIPKSLFKNADVYHSFLMILGQVGEKVTQIGSQTLLL